MSSEELFRADSRHLASSRVSVLDVLGGTGRTPFAAFQESNTRTITLRFADHDRLGDRFQCCREHGFTAAVETIVPESEHPSPASSEDSRSRVKPIPITDADEFETPLGTLSRAAYDGGVSPSGEWTTRNGADAGGPEYEVRIDRIAVPNGGRYERRAI